MDSPSNLTDFNKRVPVDKPLDFYFVCCQQFILSRDMMRRRPLHVWQELYKIINVQDVCHMGDPDYENLNSFSRNRWMCGPETADIKVYGEGGQHSHGVGKHIQG